MKNLEKLLARASIGLGALFLTIRLIDMVGAYAGIESLIMDDGGLTEDEARLSREMSTLMSVLMIAGGWYWLHSSK